MDHNRQTAADAFQRRLYDAYKAAGETGLTTKEAATNLEANYHTVYNHIKQLLRAGRLAESGIYRKGVVYHVPYSGKTPKIKVGNGEARLDDVLVAAGTRGVSAPTFAPMLVIPQTIAFLYRQANLVSAGEPVNGKAVADYRKALNVAKATLQRTIDNIDKLLIDDALWDNRVRELVEDPESQHSNETIRNACYTIENFEPPKITVNPKESN